MPTLFLFHYRIFHYPALAILLSEQECFPWKSYVIELGGASSNSPIVFPKNTGNSRQYTPYCRKLVLLIVLVLSGQHNPLYFSPYFTLSHRTVISSIHFVFLRLGNAPCDFQGAGFLQHPASPNPHIPKLFQIASTFAFV